MQLVLWALESLAGGKKKQQESSWCNNSSFQMLIMQQARTWIQIGPSMLGVKATATLISNSKKQQKGICAISEYTNVIIKKYTVSIG